VSGPTAATPARGRRLGVFGGTFDPPHIAHLVVAIAVREQLDLDEVLVMPAGEPWQKVGTRELSPAEHRLRMVELAVAGVEGVSASDVEVRREGPSYTVDTLRQLGAEEPTASLHLILGADAAAGLDTWSSAEGLPSLCTVVVVDRPGTTAEVPERYQPVRVEAPRLDLSSTDLRDRIAGGRSVRFLVPDAVISYAGDHELYGGDR